MGVTVGGEAFEGFPMAWMRTVKHQAEQARAKELGLAHTSFHKIVPLFLGPALNPTDLEVTMDRFNRGIASAVHKERADFPCSLCHIPTPSQD
ncbi:hypothetical protein MHYP_G00221380 [Metynnis hypsauchen]